MLFFWRLSVAVLRNQVCWPSEATPFAAFLQIHHKKQCQAVPPRPPCWSFQSASQRGCCARHSDDPRQHRALILTAPAHLQGCLGPPAALPIPASNTGHTSFCHSSLGLSCLSPYPDASPPFPLDPCLDFHHGPTCPMSVSFREHK